MRTRSAVLLLAGALALGAGACKDPKTPAESIAELRSPDPNARQSAADDLRTDNGVPAEAVSPLLQAIQTEQEPKVRGAILITLGRSGVPEAKPIIDQHINTDDRDMRRWASRALKYWLIANKQMGPDDPLPDGWPYGTPGFPPPLPPQE